MRQSSFTPLPLYLQWLPITLRKTDASSLNPFLPLFPHKLLLAPHMQPSIPLTCLLMKNSPTCALSTPVRAWLPLSAVSLNDFL